MFCRKLFKNGIHPKLLNMGTFHLQYFDFQVKLKKKIGQNMRIDYELVIVTAAGVHNFILICIPDITMIFDSIFMTIFLAGNKERAILQ